MKKTIGRKSVQSKRTSCKKKRSLKVKGGRKNYKKKARVTNKKKGGDNDSMDVDEADVEVSTEKKECPICTENIENTGDGVTIHCGHSFHKNCIHRWCKDKGKCTCPICRGELNDGDKALIFETNPSMETPTQPRPNPFDVYNARMLGVPVETIIATNNQPVFGLTRPRNRRHPGEPVQQDDRAPSSTINSLFPGERHSPNTIFR